MKIYYILLLSYMLITGCAGVVMESANITRDSTIRNDNMEAALAGDPEAQYRVGKSYCCAPRADADAFYNNKYAMEFLCKAARNHHAQAAYEVGKFHSGDTIDGVRLLRRAATAIRGDNLNNESIAYYWYNQAYLNGYAEAAAEIHDMGALDISQYTDPETTPCTITEVYGDR